MAKKTTKPAKTNLKPAVDKTIVLPASGNVEKNIIYAAVIAIVAIVLYIQTINYGYVLDDYSVLKKNWLTQRGIESIPTIFKTHYRYGFWNKGSEIYRPIPLSFFAIEWQLAPDKPWFSHLMNILTYALLGVVTFYTLRRWFAKYSAFVPFLITLLFIMHPIHTEVVSNIKSRDEIYAMLFCMLTCNELLKYWENSQLKNLLFSLLWFTLALFSKENSVTFLAVFPLLTYYFTDKNWTTNAKISALYILPTILYFVIRSNVLGDWDGDNQVPVLSNLLAGAANKGEQIATAFLLMGIYLVKLILPYKLVSDLGFNEVPITNFTDWRVWLSVIAYVGAGIWALTKLKERNYYAFGIAFFFITFSIFTNLIYLIGSSYGERFLFIPSLGFAICFGLGVLQMMNVDLSTVSLQNISKYIFAKINIAAPLILLLLFYGYKTFERNPDWKSGFTLFEKDSNQSPNSAMLQYHHGLELMDKWKESNDVNEKKDWLLRAKTEFEQALQIFPQYHHAFGELGLIYYRSGNPDLAMQNYRQSIQYDPNNATVFSNMGTIYYERNMRDSAEYAYSKALELDPRMVDAHRNLGTVYATSGRWQQAIKEFSEGLKYEPDDPVLTFYLGSAYRDSGNQQMGQQYLEKAYRLDPSLKK